MLKIFERFFSSGCESSVLVVVLFSFYFGVKNSFLFEDQVCTEIFDLSDWLDSSVVRAVPI